MKKALRYFYHKIRPILIRLGPNNVFMRIGTMFIMNLMCKEFETRIAFKADALEITKGRQVVRLNRNHWIYSLTISKSFQVYFDCVEPKREANRDVVDYSCIALQTFRISGLEFEVSGFPEEEKAVLDYFRWHRPREGDTVFDLGANCGLSAYYLSQCVGPTGKVYALEPDPVNFTVLLHNIQRHKLANVIPVRKAVAAATANLKFLSEGSIGSTLAHQSNRSTTGTVETVEAISLVDACATFGIPTFVKMDIEGAEIEVIAASQVFLREHPIQFAIDTNHYKNGELTSGDVEKLFRECDYEVLSSNESGFMTTWARKVA